MHKALIEVQSTHPWDMNRIVGNREGLQKLREAISRAEAIGEARIENENPQTYFIVLDEHSPQLGGSPRKQPARWRYILSAVVGVLVVALAVVGGFSTYAWFQSYHS